MDPMTISLLTGLGLSGLGGLLGGLGARSAANRQMQPLMDAMRVARQEGRANEALMMGLLRGMGSPDELGARQRAVSAQAPMPMAPTGRMPGAAVAGGGAIAAERAARAQRQAFDDAQLGAFAEWLQRLQPQMARTGDRMASNSAYAQRYAQMAQGAAQFPAYDSRLDLAGLMQMLGPLLALYGATRSAAGVGGIPLPNLGARNVHSGLLGGGV
jgi:hypothetical protein